MEHRWEKSLREDRYRIQRENPSFSSTLLDAIYRSIDESNGKSEEEQLNFNRETTMRKKHGDVREMGSLKRACMIEKWMEKETSYEKVAVRRKSMADFDKNIARKEVDAVLLNSSSSSSESSCGGGFSSSESESFYGVNTSRSSSTTASYTIQRPKPIRTNNISAWPDKNQRPRDHERSYASSGQNKPKHEGSFVKTKSKALKIYGDLKKVKQPISPGGRLASFLNSIFTAGSAKKAKISRSEGGGGYHEERKLKSEQASTCSSASSFSRSCLSKTPSSSSRGKLNTNNGAKRSVRFYPVSVIVDEDCRPCGHKNLYGISEHHHQENNMALVAAAAVTTTARKNNPLISDEKLKFHVMNESRRIEEVARDLLKNYHQKKKKQELKQFDHRMSTADQESSDEEEEEEFDDDDDDVASCASSDLFELDNLSVIGIERYREELPVYETTRIDTNRAIANGLIL